MMPDEPELRATRLTIDDGVAHVELHRPHRANAWTGRMHAEYRWCLAQCEANREVRAVVVSGAGTRFCVGADSEALAHEARKGAYDPGLPVDVARPGYDTPSLHDKDGTPFDHDLVWQWGLRVPVVMAVNGACAGVGLALASFGDVRFVAEEAVLTTAAPTLALPAEFGLSWILPRLVGLTRAADLLLTGRRFSGTQAANWGWALEALPQPDVVPAAMAYARVLAGFAPGATAATKRQLWSDQVHAEVGDSVEVSKRLIDEAMRTADFAEGVAALQERRPPRFV